MKIGIVLNNTSTESETFFTSKIKGLQDSGYQVVLFANESEDSHICRLIPHPKVSKNIILQLGQMMVSYIVLLLTHPIIFFRFLHLEKMDGIPFHTRWENLYLNHHILKEELDWIHFGFITMVIRRENVGYAIDAKMGVSLRGYDICIYPLKHNGCFGKVWDKVDKIHSISNDLLKLAQDQGLKNNTRQMVIPPAVDIENFKTSKRKWKKFDSKEKIRFLTVARLHWKKGLEYTLQALRIMKEKNISFQYTIIGEGYERERLIFAAHQLGIDEQVIFSGSIPHQYIKEYYEETDIYLQYSNQEGFCNAVLEAQAMGLITIVSDAEGLSDNVQNGKTGWVVPKRSPKDLSDKIIEIISTDNKELDQIRKNSIRRVKKYFNLEIQKKEFNKFYQDNI